MVVDVVVTTTEELVVAGPTGIEVDVDDVEALVQSVQSSQPRDEVEGTFSADVVVDVVVVGPTVEVVVMGAAGLLLDVVPQSSHWELSSGHEPLKVGREVCVVFVVEDLEVVSCEVGLTS